MRKPYRAVRNVEAAPPMGWPTRTSAADQEIRPTRRSVGRASSPAFGLLAELFLRDGLRTLAPSRGVYLRHGDPGMSYLQILFRTVLACGLFLPSLSGQWITY